MDDENGEKFGFNWTMIVKSHQRTISFAHSDQIIIQITSTNRIMMQLADLILSAAHRFPQCPKGVVSGHPINTTAFCPVFQRDLGGVNEENHDWPTKPLEKKHRFFPTRFLPTPLGAKIETAGGDQKTSPSIGIGASFFFPLSLSLLKLVRSHSWGWSLPLKRRSYTFGKLTWQTWTTLHLFLKNGWISKPAMCAWSNLHSNKKAPTKTENIFRPLENIQLSSNVQ